MAPATKHHLLLFGDQTDDITGTIAQLYADSRYSKLLADFLRRASDVLQVELGHMDPAFRSEVPPFESIQQMAEEHAKTDGSPVFQSCLLSYIARVGELIIRAERDHTLLTSERTVVGLCINLLPAALAAYSTTATELVRNAVEALPTYTELVIKSFERSKMVEKADGYWSHLLMRPADLDIQPAVDKFNADYKIPQHKKAWIGVVGRTWSTISAPPSVLTKLVENCEEIKALPGMTLPVRGAVHAGHLPNILYDDVVKPSFIGIYPCTKRPPSCRPIPLCPTPSSLCASVCV